MEIFSFKIMESSINPIAFSVGSIDIRWYGILISIAMILSSMIIYRRATYHQIEPEKTLDMAIWTIPIGIIGARAYFVIFNWSYYSGDFLKMIDIRSGGLAIHGGLIFGGITLWIVCKIYGYKILNVLDLVAPVVALGQGIGRWGNFFNGEAHGGVTTFPLAVIVNGEKYHPTFLYESIWCILLFIVLSIIDRKRLFNGQVFLLYGMAYSFERFFVEYLRTDSLMLFGTLKQAMVLSAVVFVIFLIIYIFRRRKAKKMGKIFYGGESKYIDRF